MYCLNGVVYTYGVYARCRYDIRYGDGTYTFMYFATTCATSAAPEIFGAEGGYGIAALTIG